MNSVCSGELPPPAIEYSEGAGGDLSPTALKAGASMFAAKAASDWNVTIRTEKEF